MKKISFLRKSTLVAAFLGLSVGVTAQDWANIAVPASAGAGKTWQLQENLSDDFNYSKSFSAGGYANKSNFGPNNQWYNFYHNAWDGPGYTYWNNSQVSVDGNNLAITVGHTTQNSKGGTYGVASGCVTSNNKVSYPAYVEASVSVANISLASCFWLLSPDDTEEIDIIENYGGVPWFNTFTHISHHSFVRNPFTDYQPRDKNSWYPIQKITDAGGWGTYCWNGGNRRYMRMGVNWIGPKHFEYYIDGELVRVMYYNAMATLINGTWQYTYYQSTTQDSNGYHMPTNGSDGYSLVTSYTTSSAYSFSTLQAASNASNGYNVIDTGWFQGGDNTDIDGNGITVEAKGFTKELDIIINMESQSWLTGSTPSAADLADPSKNKMLVDWVRVYKPIAGNGNGTVAVSGITLTPTAMTLEIGETGNLTASVSPANASTKTMTFASSNPAVATVSNSGVVTALAAGTTTITTTSTDGSFTDTSTITVNAAGSGSTLTIEAEGYSNTGGSYNDSFAGGPGLGVNQAGTAINYVNGGDWADYLVTVPSAGEYACTFWLASPNSGTSISLSANGTSISATVPNTGQWNNYQAVTGSTTINLNAGQQSLRIAASGGTWTWNLDKFTLARLGPKKSKNLALDNQAALTELKLFPNPAVEQVNINGLVTGTYTLRVLNLYGQVVKTASVDATQQLSLGVSELKQGTYLLHIQGKQLNKTLTFNKN